jgi:adenosylcobinamide kinase/adenosylcobinamide-phosphate guanylyltransferase
MSEHLILGGARSGKSRYAEQEAMKIAEQNDQQLVYIATATAGDNEMAERINHHQARRGSDWLLVEAPLSLSDAIGQYSSDKYCILVDCLTLWLSNCLLENLWIQERKQFLNTLGLSSASILMVSNEVGSGVVPMGELSRKFVDESGWLHQELATICEKVTLVTAGLPLQLK